MQFSWRLLPQGQRAKQYASNRQLPSISFPAVEHNKFFGPFAEANDVKPAKNRLDLGQKFLMVFYKLYTTDNHSKIDILTKMWQNIQVQILKNICWFIYLEIIEKY